MKNILVLGACGQIGSELVTELRKQYGDNHVIATDLCDDGKGKILSEGPFHRVDVTDGKAIFEMVKKYHIDTIYNLAALLSALAEQKPHTAWNVGINGLYNVLEVARENDCAVFFPSSIGAFGPTTPHHNTPQDTIQRPQTMYGVTKVTGELLSDYYHKRFGVDTAGFVIRESFPTRPFREAEQPTMLLRFFMKLYAINNIPALWLPEHFSTCSICPMPSKQR